MASYPKISTLCFFGSFDPPHFGHLAVVKVALSGLPFIEKLLIIPAYRKVPYKNLAETKHRLKMVKKLFGNIDSRIRILEMDIDDMLMGKTIDPLKKIARGEKNSVGILFGADAFTNLERWKLVKEILEFTYLFIIPRGKMTPENIRSHPFFNKNKNRILVLENEIESFLDASSTKVKQHIKSKGSSEYTDKSISRYIKANKLYGS